MANYPIQLVCDECYEALEHEIIEGATTDRIYVKPCKVCAAQQSMHPTSETLRDKLALLTPEQLSALEVLLTPLTCG